MPDSLNLVTKSPFLDAVAKLEDLVSQSNRAFLLGAGCSRCAGLPLTFELTNLILNNHDLRKETKELLSILITHYEGSNNVTIEDFLSELVDLLAITERRNERGAKKVTVKINDKDYTIDELQAAIIEIKERIVECIDIDTDISTHWQFIKAVHRVQRSGKTSANHTVDYFILNYDTLIEDALALERLTYADGFLGGTTAYWDAKSFDSNLCDARVLKVHGSIDWCEIAGELLPSRIRSSLKLPTGAKKRVLIWPASTKYRETQNDPYAQILGIMRKSLRPTTNAEVVLSICGYRFGDAHINIEIDRALRESNKALTLLVFTEMKEPEGILKTWIDDEAVKEQVLVYSKGGFFHGSNSAKSNEDLPWWKFENLTRLLGGER